MILITNIYWHSSNQVQWILINVYCIQGSMGVEQNVIISTRNIHKYYLDFKQISYSQVPFASMEFVSH